MTDNTPETATDSFTPAAVTETTEEMTRLGIVVHPANRFHYGEYRYTNLSDAIAQAKRDGKTG